MDRRQFFRLTVGTVLVLPVGRFLVQCSSSMSATGAEEPGAAPVQEGNEIVYTTSVVSSHAHTFGLEIADIDSPPAAGVSGTTSTEQSHAHTVGISMAMLAGVAAGQTVPVTTGVASAHTHVLPLVRIGTAPGADGGGGGGGGGAGGGGGGGGY